MYTMGVDIGSASSKVVILEDGKNILGKVVVPVGTGSSGPERALKEVYAMTGLQREDITGIIATGYGRIVFKDAFKQVSEISCHAKGVLHLLPDAKTIIDIGGQDAKVIKIGPTGGISNFAMNEKCAAGTGRFLEVMARVLEVDVSNLADLGAEATSIVTISSTCTVFAESEVISQLAANVRRADVAAGVHISVAHRVVGLAKRVGVEEKVVMTGGVAKNAGVVQALENELQLPITVCPDSQITGALGAAILAYEGLLENVS